MLWPDNSLDLYEIFPTIKWMRKICDVGDEFHAPNLWKQFWEYHGLRGETEAGGAGIQQGRMPAMSLMRGLLSRMKELAEG